MADLSNFKISHWTFESSEASLQDNITSEWSDVATWTVPDNRLVLPLNKRIFRLMLTATEAFTSQDISGSGTANLDLSSIKIPNPLSASDNNILKILADLDGAGSKDWDSEYTDFDSINYWDADTNPNRVIVNEDNSHGSADLKVIVPFVTGSVRFMVEMPAGNNLKRMSMGNYTLKYLHQANYEKPEAAPRLSTTFPLIEKMKLHLQLKTPRTLYWHESGEGLGSATLDNDVAFAWIPVAIANMSEAPSDMVERVRAKFGV